jgi:hypothetical protein
MKKRIEVHAISRKLETKITISNFLADSDEVGCCLVTTNDGTTQFPTTLKGCQKIANTLGGDYEFNPGGECEED